MAKTIDIRMGALSPKIGDQLKEQGCVAAPSQIKRWQSHSEAITQLLVANLLTRGEVDKARKRLFADICKTAKSLG